MKTSYFQFLSRAYVLDTSYRSVFLRSLILSCFVFVMMWLSRNSVLFSLTYKHVLLAAGIGLASFLILSLCDLGLKMLAPAYWSEEKWTTGLELLRSLTGLLLAGTLTFYLASWMGMDDFYLRRVIKIGVLTLGFWILPVSWFILHHQSELEQKYMMQAEQLNARLNSVERVKNMQALHTGHQPFHVRSKSSGQNLTLDMNDVLYLYSDMDGTALFYIRDGQIHKELLKASVQALTEEFNKDLCLFRVHRKYLINLCKLVYVQGDARGFKLQIQGSEKIIPVSGMYEKALKKRVSAKTT